MKKTSEMDYKLWDLTTVTAGDFTVELNITKTMWETFKVQRATHEQLPPGDCTPNHVGT